MVTVIIMQFSTYKLGIHGKKHTHIAITSKTKKKNWKSSTRRIGIEVVNHEKTV